MKRRLTLATLAILTGLFAGTGVYTFFYAKGFSYMSTDPEVCINCHIMRAQYDGWVKSSHHAAARCVDCHMPENLVHKLIAKTDNGWRHSVAFTLQNFHEPIQIIPRNSRILQANCVRCHRDLVHGMGATADGSRVNCVHCHAGVGHGDQIGLGKYDPAEYQEDAR